MSKEENVHPVDYPLITTVRQELKDVIVAKVKELAKRYEYQPVRVKWYRGQWLVESGYVTGHICDDAGGSWSQKRRDALWAGIDELVEDQVLIVVRTSCYHWLGLYDPGEQPTESRFQFADPKELIAQAKGETNDQTDNETDDQIEDLQTDS